MFGQQKTGGFGGFGQSTFGGGQSTGFGTPTAGGGLFGSNTSTTGGGLFGTSAANTSGFGAQTGQAGGTFSFGQQQPATGGGLFGGAAQPQQQTSSIFGTPTTSSVFGAKTPQPAGAFGQTTSATGLFGGTTTATSGTSLFGQPAAATAQPTGGLFGSSSGAFGSALGGAPAAGTTIKFNPPSGTDTMMKGGTSQSISTRHQCITAMKEYEGKSLEELRCEDYAANRKGPQQAAGGMFGAVGTTPATSTGFGGFGQQQNKPATGFGGFGATTSTASGGLFGTPQQQSGTSLFGQTTKPAGGLFGATTTTTASTGFGGFGSGTTGATSLFGQTATQPKPGGLFGTGTATSQATGGLFGTAPAATGFGGVATSTGFGGFGQAQPAQQGGLFGSKPTAFGAPATSTTGGFGGFGATTQLGQTTGGLFGQKPATSGTAFNFAGTAAPATGFGVQPQAGGLFGAKPTGFGTATQPGLAGGTGFGTLGTGLGTGSSLFGGAQKPTLGTGIGAGFGTGVGGFGAGLGGGIGTGAVPGVGLGQNAMDQALAAQQLQIQQQLAALTNSPYGDSPLFKNLKHDDAKREEAMKPTNPTAQKAALAGTPQYKVTPRPTAKIKPKPIHSHGNKSQLFDGFEDDDSSFGPSTLVPRKSIKRLMLRNGQVQSNLNDSINSNQSWNQLDTELVSPVPPHQVASQQSQESAHDIERNEFNGDSGTPVITGSTLDNSMVDTPKGGSNLDDSLAVFRRKLRPMQEPNDSVIVEEDEEDVAHPAGIKLRRHGYYTMPPLEELATMVAEDGSCFINEFVVGREGYGNVFFPGKTNVTGLDLDAIVHFRRKEITVYPDDNQKPEEGDGLNKRAQVTLDCVWPNDKSTQEPIMDADRLLAMNYQDRIEKATRRIGGKFIDYRPETGSWVFEVKHFSKYGLADDSDDELDDQEADPKKLLLLKQQQQQQLDIQRKKIETYQLEQQRLAAQKKENDIQEVPQQNGTMKEDGEQIDATGLCTNTDMLQDKDSESLGDDDSDMADLAREKFPDEFEGLSGGMVFDDDAMEMTEVVPSSHRMAVNAGVDPHQHQIMKASFFGEDDDDDMDIGRSGLGGGSLAGLGGGSLGGLSSMIPSGFRSQPRTPSVPTLTEQPSMLNSSLHRSMRESPLLNASPQRPSQTLAEKLAQTAVSSPRNAFRPVSVVRPSLPEAAERVIIPSGLTDEDKPCRMVGTRVQRCALSLDQSMMCRRESLLMDHSLLRGRSCRVGWGPSMTLVHAGQPVHCTNKTGGSSVARPCIVPSISDSSWRGRLDATPYTVQLEKVDVSLYSPQANATLRNMIEQSLATQLRHSVVDAESSCPLYIPRPGVEALHEHAQLTHTHAETLGNHPDLDYTCQARLVFDLAVALWGQLPEIVNSVTEMEETSYQYRQARREAFSQWLASACSRRIKRETQNARFKGGHHLEAVLSHLSGRQVSEAASVAQSEGDYRLSLLLAQAAGSDSVRQMLVKQLNNWEQQKADRFIERERLRIYSLLAGLMVWPSSQGSINVCEDLDWKRCLAIHLWYLCSPTASVADALAAYDSAFKGETTLGRYAATPLPPYLEDSMFSTTSCDEDAYCIRDMCYHMMRLQSDRSHRMERLLSPTTITANHLDYRLSWLMWQILQSLEYTHLSHVQAAAICAGFAAQLESLDLWHWAAFVLLHIPDHASREHAVRALLERHVDLSEDEDTCDRHSFLTDKLAIPPAWLHKAKARHARASGRHHDEAWHLLKAGHWNESHHCLLTNVASDAIINEDYTYLKRFLREMSPPEYCCGIQDWAIGGKVFLDYVTMVETLDEIKRGDVSTYELEKLEPEVTSLCNRIGNLCCRTPKDRLCQSEMATRTAHLLRTLLALKTSTHQNTKHVPTKLIVPQLSKLPMPEDYALQELRDLTRSYMLEMTS